MQVSCKHQKLAPHQYTPLMTSDKRPRTRTSLARTGTNSHTCSESLEPIHAQSRPAPTYRTVSPVWRTCRRRLARCRSDIMPSRDMHGVVSTSRSGNAPENAPSRYEIQPNASTPPLDACPSSTATPPRIVTVTNQPPPRPGFDVSCHRASARPRGLAPSSSLGILAADLRQSHRNPLPRQWADCRQHYVTVTNYTALQAF